MRWRDDLWPGQGPARLGVPYYHGALLCKLIGCGGSFKAARAILVQRQRVPLSGGGRKHRRSSTPGPRYASVAAKASSEF